MKVIGKITDVAMTQQGGLVMTIYDKRILRLLDSRCPICGEKEPMMFETLSGAAGCKHWREMMRERSKHCPTCGQEVIR